MEADRTKVLVSDVSESHGNTCKSIIEAINGSLIVDGDGKTRVRDFPGFFRMGEFVTGQVDKGTSDQYIVLNIKGKEKPYSLSQLKEMRDLHERFAGK